MKHRVFTLLGVTLLAALVIFPVHAQSTNLTDGCVDKYDTSVDYFPEKVTVSADAGFSVDYFNNYKVVTVSTPWQGADKPLQYVLVQCGTPAPTTYQDAPVIQVPVKSIVALSTSFLPHIVQQGLIDKLVGVDSILYTSTPEVLQKFKDGKLAEVGGGGSGGDTNIEKLVDLQPDLVMTQRFNDQDKSFPAMKQAGLNVVINADFLATSPLGVAEWGKYIAVYFNTEAKAQTQFDGVKERYETLTQKAAAVTDKPTVFSGTPYQDTWYMPGGKSYLAHLLADAGSAYLWADDSSTGSLALDFETVFDKAADADFWVNVIVWRTLDDAKAADERFTQFAAYKSGNIYTNTARSNENGGSDYYESGYANPDVILADLITIFHPDLLPDHHLYYYLRLAPAAKS